MSRFLWMKSPHSREGELVRIPTGEDILIREDNRVERLCKHGVGHPIGHVSLWQLWMGVHGCDGCCGTWEKTQ